MRIDFYKFIDKYFGKLFIILLSSIKFFFKKNDDKNSFLIIKLWAVGDSVVALPLIRSLRRNFPKSRIVVFARERNCQVFEMVDFIDEIILFEPKYVFKLFLLFRKYDVVFDLEPYLNLSAVISFMVGKFSVGFANQFRSRLYDERVVFDKNKHMVENYLDFCKAIGVKLLQDDYSLVKLKCFGVEEKHVESFIASKNVDSRRMGLIPRCSAAIVECSFLGVKNAPQLAATRIFYLNKSLVGVCVGTAESASKTRVWNDKKWALLCDSLIEKLNAEVIFFGAKKESKYISCIQLMMRNKSINSAGELNLKSAVCLISKCDLFISIDTGPMHIASCQGIKTIGLFGPNTPKLWSPYGNYNVSIYKSVECSPCIQNDKGYMPDCLRKTDKYLCMNLISVSEVFEAGKRLLK